MKLQKIDRRRSVMFIAAILLFGANACAEEGGVVTVESTRELIEMELRAGASSEEIEAFFERNGIVHSYDRFQNRYQGRIGVSDTQVIFILLLLDETRRYIRHDVQYHYISL
jgi:hypothetical protein